MAKTKKVVKNKNDKNKRGLSRKEVRKMTKKMAKRFLAVITATILAFSLLPLVALAHEIDDDHDHSIHSTEAIDETPEVCEDCGYEICVCIPEDLETKMDIFSDDESGNGTDSEGKGEQKVLETPKVCDICKETDCDKDHVRCVGCNEWDHDCFEGMGTRTDGSVKVKCPACGTNWNQYKNVVLYFDGTSPKAPLVKAVVTCSCGAVSTWDTRSNNGATFDGNGGGINNVQLGNAILISVFNPNDPGQTIDPDDKDPEDKDPDGKDPEDKDPEDNDPETPNRPGRPERYNHRGRPHGRPNKGGEPEGSNELEDDDEDPVILDDDDDDDDDDDNNDPVILDDEDDEDDKEDETVVNNGGNRRNRNRNSSNGSSAADTAVNTNQTAPLVNDTEANMTQMSLLSNPVPASIAQLAAPVSSMILSNPEVPTATTVRLPAWALLNLILAILTGMIMTAMLVTFFGKKEDEDGEIKRKGVLRLISIIPALIAAVLFLLTEDMRNPMIVADSWTIWMAVIAIVQTALAVLSTKKHADNDDEITQTA